MTEQTGNSFFIVISTKALKIIHAKKQWRVTAMSQSPHKSGIPLPLFLYVLLLLLLLTGCASLPHGKDILVLVDGDPITTEDYVYSLEIEHRREDMSSAQSLDLDEYLQKLIDNKLIVQEARRMNMDEFPEVKQKKESYVLRESVTRLYNDEILNKVSVSEDDITEYYRENYERLAFSVIESSAREEAVKLLEQLRSGTSFSELAQKHGPQALKDQTELVMTRKALGTKFGDSIAALKGGETSDIIENGGKFYIIKLFSRQDAPEKDLENNRKKIANEIKHQKVQDRSAEYIRYLRESIKPEIRDDILTAIVFDGKDDTREKWLKDQRPLAEIEGTVLTAGEFTAMLSDTTSNKEAVLKQWLDRKLVDIEALKRQYAETSDLKDMVKRYEEQILKNTFISTVLFSQIKISDADLKAHYADHQDEFMKPEVYKVQQITVKSREEAEDIESSLKGGASFSWLAKTRSADSYAEKGGEAGWVMKSHLPHPLQEIIDSMNPGDTSPVVGEADYYRIYMLQEKSRKEPEDFGKVKSSVQARVFREKFQEIFNSYTEKLRNDAEVIMYPENLDSFQKMFKNAKN